MLYTHDEYRYYSLSFVHGHHKHVYSCMYKSILEFTIHPQYLCTENLDLYSHVARPLSAARHLLLAVEVPTPATRKPYIYAVCQIF